MHVNYKCQVAPHWHTWQQCFSFQQKYFHTWDFAPKIWTNWTNSLIFQHHMTFICSGQWLSDQLRTSIPCLWILRRWKTDERCRTVPSRAGELGFVRVCVRPSRSCRKAQDTTGTSALLSLLHAAGGKHFARSCVQQLRHSHKASSPSTHPAHHPSQVRRCKRLEKKGKYRLILPCYTPTPSFLLVNPLRGSRWCVCANSMGTSASLQLGVCCLFPCLQGGMRLPGVRWKNDITSLSLQQGRDCSWHLRTSFRHSCDTV